MISPISNLALMKGTAPWPVGLGATIDRLWMLAPRPFSRLAFSTPTDEENTSTPRLLKRPQGRVIIGPTLHSRLVRVAQTDVSQYTIVEETPPPWGRGAFGIVPEKDGVIREAQYLQPGENRWLRECFDEALPSSHWSWGKRTRQRIASSRSACDDKI